MASPSLKNSLAGKNRIFLDTVAIIYYIEDNPKYRPILDPLFETIESGIRKAASSYITLVEVLIKPLRLKNTLLAQTYKDTLLAGGLNIEAIEKNIAVLTAEIRAQYNIRVPDAIQVAHAIMFNSDAFVTNDRKIQAVHDRIPVIILDDELEKL